MNKFENIWLDIIKTGINNLQNSYSSNQKNSFEILLIKLCFAVSIPDLQKILLDLKPDNLNKNDTYMYIFENEYGKFEFFFRAYYYLLYYIILDIYIYFIFYLFIYFFYHISNF